MVILIKPQFEAGRKQVGKGGIVKNEQAQQGARGRSPNRVGDILGVVPVGHA